MSKTREKKSLSLSIEKERHVSSQKFTFVNFSFYISIYTALLFHRSSWNNNKKDVALERNWPLTTGKAVTPAVLHVRFTYFADIVIFHEDDSLPSFCN
jgi:hypothetical protein